MLIPVCQKTAQDKNLKICLEALVLSSGLGNGYTRLFTISSPMVTIRGIYTFRRHPRRGNDQPTGHQQRVFGVRIGQVRLGCLALGCIHTRSFSLSATLASAHAHVFIQAARRNSLHE